MKSGYWFVAVLVMCILFFLWKDTPWWLYAGREVSEGVAGGLFWDGRVNSLGEQEYAATVNSEELGDLKLTLEEEVALVAFMNTLTDGYKTE